MLEYFDIKPVLLIISNPKYNTNVEWVHQVISKILVTKDLDNKYFDYIDPWGDILASIAWVIRYSYHRTIGDTSVQSDFSRDNIFNLASVVDW